MTATMRHVRDSRRALLARLLLVAALVASAGCTIPVTVAASGRAESVVSTSPAAAPVEPVNIVFVLTDDLTGDLVRFMPHVRDMQRRGTTFTNYTVTDSQCCPSRSSILTGKYPHDTQVFTNTPPWGGYAVFHELGEEQTTFAMALHDHGYRTAFMGKYLNGYQAGSATRPGSPVPPGWDEWDGVGFGYPEYGYDMAHGSTSTFYGHRRRDYLTTVLRRYATGFIGSAAASGQPFFLEVATFTPHTPSVPAPRDRRAFRRLVAPRPAAFNRLPTDSPTWLAGRHRLTRGEVRDINHRYRRRAQAVLSVDRLLGRIQQALTEAGVAQRTVVVFSSDNGYHLGEHRLLAGKMTAFDTDVEVPLVVTGPDVRAHAVNADAVQNIDLAPTFEQLAGLDPSPLMDGVSIVELLRQDVPGWSNAALIEHHGPDTDVGDPDFPGPLDANPPSYEAMRTTRYTYVEYVGGEVELYDRSTDPDQLHNIAGQVSPEQRAELHRELAGLSGCHGAVECTAARTVP